MKPFGGITGHFGHFDVSRIDSPRCALICTISSFSRVPLSAANTLCSLLAARTGVLEGLRGCTGA